MTENTSKKRKIRPLGPNGIVKNWSSTDVNVYKTEHLWVISHYSFHNAKGTQLKSSKFTSDFNGNAKCAWYMYLEPKGESNEEDSISLFLYLDRTSHCKSVYANVQFSIMSSEQKVVYSRKTSIREFSISSDGEKSNRRAWGFFSFLSRYALLHGKKELLSNDELTIFCEITYSQVIFTSTSHQSNSITFQAPVPSNRVLQDFGLLLKNRKFTDVTIVVNDTKYPVHKAILAARSAVFSAMFERNDMRENVRNCIVVTDIGVNVMEEMLRYIYTGNVENLDDLADDLFQAADKYDLGELKAICENVLSSNLSDDSAAKTLVLADLHRAYELKSKTMDYIVLNSVNVMRTDGWKIFVTGTKNDLLNEVCQALSRKLAGN